MNGKRLRPALSVVAHGESLISTAGAVLMCQTARVTGLDRALSQVLARWRAALAIHDPGKIVADLAIAVALGGDCAADIALVRAQPGVFGLVASDPTVSRLISRLADDEQAAVAAIRAARATARERAWGHAGAPRQDGLVVIDLDATLVTAHSDKQWAAPTWKKTFGFHPLLGTVDHGACGTGEPVVGLLRPGNAGSNTAADHIAVFDAALAQLPAEVRARGAGGRRDILVRTDAAGATHRFAEHLAAHGVQFSLGAYLHHFDTARILDELPSHAWHPAIDADDQPREGAWVAEATEYRRPVGLAGRYPADPAQGTPPPGRATAVHRRRRAPGHRVSHQQQRRRARRPGAAPPPPRPRRGPHPRGQGHRAAQPTLPRRGGQPDLA